MMKPGRFSWLFESWRDMLGYPRIQLFGRLEIGFFYDRWEWPKVMTEKNTRNLLADVRIHFGPFKIVW